MATDAAVAEWLKPYAVQRWGGEDFIDEGYDIPGEGRFNFVAPWKTFQNYTARDDITPAAFRQEMFPGGRVINSPVGELFAANSNPNAREMSRPTGREWIAPVIQMLLTAGLGAAASGAGAVNSSEGFDFLAANDAAMGGGGFDFLAANDAAMAAGEGTLFGSGAGAGGLNWLNTFDTGAMANILKTAPGAGTGLSNIFSSIQSLPWGTIAKVGDLASGLYGLTRSRKLEDLARAAAQSADPFGPYRSLAGSKFGELLSNPASITSAPGWEAGMQAVERSMLAQGYQGSGNMMQALQKAGGDFYNNQLMMLAQLAGANVNPANASQVSMNGVRGALDLQGNSLNRILASIMKLGAA